MIGQSFNTLALSLEQWRLADILLVAGLGLIGLWLVLWAVSARRPKSAAAPTLTPVEQLERRKQTDGLHRDLEQVMVEIETLAKRLGNDLDHRAARVEMLLQQADQKAAEIEQLLAQLRAASQSAATSTSTSAPAPVAPKLARMAAESKPVEQEDTAGDPPPLSGSPISALVTPRPPMSMTPPARTPPRPAAAPLAPGVARPAAPAAAATATLDDPLARSVYRLADQGMQPIEIARKLSEQVGKIELILALRQV